jgi:beta-glucosidase
MTDWNTYESCDLVEIVQGGNNWLTPGSPDDKYTKPLMEAVENGILSRDVLVESVSCLLYMIATLKKRRKS